MCNQIIISANSETPPSILANQQENHGYNDQLKWLLKILADKDHVLANYKINRNSLIELLQHLVRTHKSTKDNQYNAENNQHSVEMEKAAIYCRKSTSKGIDGYAGLPELPLSNQEALCREYCMHNNLTVSKVVHEITSARDMDKMTKLNELVAQLEPGTVLLVSDVSRFSRNVLQALVALNELSQKQVSVHAVNPNCTFDEQSLNKFQFRSHLNQAELESDIISDRVKKSIDTRRKLGCKIGKSKFGFECYYDDRGLRRERENEKEQGIIDMIKDKLDSGNTTAEVAGYLNENDETFRGKKWTSAHINRIARQITETNSASQKGASNHVERKLRTRVRVKTRVTPY
jgi:DNA invertase Pin-like site-specific DNA recombinase